MKGSSLFLLIPGALAFQLPFHIPFFKSQGVIVPQEEPFKYTTPRVAIIGAGAGGSSAAFWISKAKERFGLDVEIDVYDREDYVGGRSTVVYPYDNTSLPALELGASIFVKANKNLWRASDEFNLTRRDFQDEEDTAIWDGQKLLVSFSGSWWDTLKIIWRYGIFAPRKTNKIVAEMLTKFMKLYASDTPKWDNVSDVAAYLGWTTLVQFTTSEYLLSQGVSEKFSNEIVEAATRVNYGQNVDEIHGLAGIVSLAANGASAIQGGNFQIFEQFLNRSSANVFLNTSVLEISQKHSTSQSWMVKSTRGSVDYKGVILAAPFHSTKIVVPLSISDQIPKQPYVNLHVTLLTTTSPYLNSSYFGLPENVKVPRTLLSTFQGVREGGKEPEFNSISYHGSVREGEWAVKIFSKQRIDDQWLEQMFQGKVNWVYRKVWDAYPILPPTSTFPPTKLDQGFYYINSFEPFISTMETETIASRNVADLLLNEEFRSSICGPTISGSERSTGTSAEEGDFVVGWDC